MSKNLAIKGLLADVRTLTTTVNKTAASFTFLIPKSGLFVNGKGTRDNLVAILGAERYEKFKTSLQEKLAPEREPGKFPNADDMKGIVDAIEAANKAKPNGNITLEQYNTMLGISEAVLETMWDEIIAENPSPGETWEDQCTAVLGILIGETPATPEAVATAIAQATGAEVKKTVAEQPAPTAPTTPPAVPATEAPNLPATEAQISGNAAIDAIAANIRQRMIDLQADEASIAIIDAELNAIKNRASRERGAIFQDMESFYAMVKGSATAEEAVAAVAEAAEETAM